jgi:hypothetical protein
MYFKTPIQRKIFKHPQSGKFKNFCKYSQIKAEAKSIPMKGEVLIGNV